MGYAYDYLPKNDPQLRALVRYAEMAFNGTGLTCSPAENPTAGTVATHDICSGYPHQDETWIQVSNPKNGRAVTLCFNGHSMLADGYMPTGEEFTVRVAQGPKIGPEIVIANAPLGSQIGDWLKPYAARIPDDIDQQSRQTAMVLGGSLPADAYSAMQGKAFDHTPMLAAAVGKYLEDKNPAPLLLKLE